MVGIARDVTADRNAAQEREHLLRSEAAARTEAERQSRLKDEFLATLSHELRTPMNAVLGWLSILESGKPIREIHSALAVIRRNAQLQAKLIDDLLDMNRLMAGNVTVEPSLIDVATLVQATMQSLQPMAQQKDVQLLAVVDSNSGQLTADTRRLQQVLWNIVHNAVKFTPAKGRVELRVRDRTEPSTSPFRTTARASRRSSCRTCSSASGRRTPRPRASSSVSDWAWPSPSSSSNCMAEPLKPRVEGKDAAPPS